MKKKENRKRRNCFCQAKPGQEIEGLQDFVAQLCGDIEHYRSTVDYALTEILRRLPPPPEWRAQHVRPGEGTDASP